MTNKILFFLSLSLFLGSCSSSTPVASLEQSNESGKQPFFSEQQVDQITTNITKTTIVSGLEHPWGMAWLPNGDILITERAGRLRLVQNGQLQPRSIEGIPEVYNSGQGGLMDISLHPDFSSNQWVYFTYSAGDGQANQTRIARAKYNNDQLTDWEDIFVVTPLKSGSQHFGSRIIWLPDQTMLIAIGDGGNPPLKIDGDLSRKQAQNLGSHLGKVVRINDNGSIPEDNPFVDNPDAEPEVWSYGHRNIQGMVFDDYRNKVWATEHGSRGGDELNLVQSQNNYGWPDVSFSDEYISGRPVAPVNTRDDITNPIRVWTPSIAPSGLAVYTGDRHMGWYGNLFAGGLVSRDIRRMQIEKDGAMVIESRIVIGQRVRDVRISPDGNLYVLTDEDSGQLIKVQP